MKKLYICILFLFLVNMITAQNNDCSKYSSDENYFRYTASGTQEVINGNHSKAINESRKRANIIAESELAKMVASVVTSVTEKMSLENDAYSEMIIDTSLVSSFGHFTGIKTVCQSDTELMNGFYVTYVTKEISLSVIGNMIDFDDRSDKKKFMELLRKEK